MTNAIRNTRMNSIGRAVRTLSFVLTAQFVLILSAVPTFGQSLAAMNLEISKQNFERTYRDIYREQDDRYPGAWAPRPSGNSIAAFNVRESQMKAASASREHHPWSPTAPSRVPSANALNIQQLEAIVMNDLDVQINYAMNGVPREFYVEHLEARFHLWRTAADHGIPAGQCLLGDCCYFGFAGPQSNREAFIWYQKAAGQGFLPAINEVGLYFMEGIGVEQDEEKGLWLIRYAANKGYVPAKLNLRVLFEGE